MPGGINLKSLKSTMLVSEGFFLKSLPVSEKNQITPLLSTGVLGIHCESSHCER